jgi:hypothetical protein
VRRLSSLAAIVVAIVACGRVGFESRVASDAETDGALPATIQYVKPIAQRHPGAGSADSFVVQASAAGNAIVLQVACSLTPPPTSLNVNAPGWSLREIGTFGTFNGLRTALFTALAPDTQPVTMTITWNMSCAGKSELGDEFTNNALDPIAAFGAGVQSGSMGSCTSTITTERDNAAVWSACFSSLSVTAIGSGYSMGADNDGGDWTEYKVTTDPAGTMETPTFTSTATFMASTISINPR